MTFQPGDRVRWESVGDDGLPLVRYGFVGAGVANGQVHVMLDGEFKGTTVLPAMRAGTDETADAYAERVRTVMHSELERQTRRRRPIIG